MKRKSDSKTFVIGGGNGNQMAFKDLIKKIFEALGSSDPDSSQLTQKPNCAEWCDTSESEAILRYQERTIEDYTTELKKKLL
jgi:hypothetical protein